LNDLFVTLGIEDWKRLLSGLVMPPVPFLVLVLVGAGWIARRRLLGWSLVLVGVASIWITSTTAGGEALMRLLLSPPPALTPAAIADLRRPAAAAPRTTIVVLGAGRELQAPEYGLSTLSRLSVERLRYGLWLARETGLPVGFAGGVGHGADPGPTEAELAQRIAEREFGRPLRWVETESRDTHENALRALRVIAPLGFERIVLVTHGFHMPRAVAAFERAAARQGIRLAIVPAPLGMGSFVPPHADGLLPSAQGFELTRLALHEWLGRLAGA
jgi:uncharacterized SAM-binding protein YcdF (DUF218 family)